MPNLLARAALLSLVSLGGAAGVPAQSPAPKEVPASVSGRVTNGERGQAGVVLVVMKANEFNPGAKPVARTTTDQGGNYTLANIPPGRYQLVPLAPAHVVPDLGGYPPGRPLTLGAGDAAEDIDFALTNGGVITGRVTDVDGRAVIGEPVQATRVETNQSERPGYSYSFRFQTDDRGVYRIYGLPAGRYRVSVGQDRESGTVRVGGPGRYYQRTFSPGTADEAAARVIEVAAGGEATDVDITLGKPGKTYKAAGRVLYADTGEPAPDIRMAYSALMGDGRRMGGVGSTGVATNARGEFQIEGLAPARYAVFAFTQANTDRYSEATTFEVNESDVAGLVVKLRRGASMSGVVQIEGTGDRAALARLMSQITLYSSTEPRVEVFALGGGGAKPAPDGSFRVGGIRPGRVRIGLGPPVKGLTLVRLERDGVPQPQGIEVAEGAHVSGVRVVLVYGTAVVRGQLQVVRGELPRGARLRVHARRVGASGDALSWQPSEVDTRGRFVLEGLAAGDYELVVGGVVPGHGQREIRQNISVPEAGVLTVTLTLDLGAAAAGGPQ